MELTPHQQQKFDETIQLIKDGHRRIIFQGSAGVGKTFLAAKLIEYIKKDRDILPNRNYGQVFVTAPTNKALAVLKAKVFSPVEFKTIHSALRLKRYIDQKSGQVRFVKEKYYDKNDEFPKAKLCVIDECSMLNVGFVGGVKKKADGTEEIVTGYLDSYPFPIIFIGDNKQLNPVGEPTSPVFLKDWPVVELTEIVRQGAGNPIIQLSRNLSDIFEKIPNMVDGKGYLYNDFRGDIIDMLAEVNGSDEVKYLAYTNADVDEMNALVRERIYGKPRKIEQGEQLVFDAPHGNHFTNEEVRVEKLELVADFIPVPRRDTKFDRNNAPINGTDKIKLRFYRINESFNIIHEDSQKMFTTICNDLQLNCKKYGWDWRGWFYFVELFAQTKYNHAITVHKSQGSTYQRAIVNIGNINFNRNEEEKTRMLYTAVTRAAQLVILNNVR
jgi:hypothetical protein